MNPDPLAQAGPYRSRLELVEELRKRANYYEDRARSAEGRIGDERRRVGDERERAKLAESRLAEREATSEAEDADLLETLNHVEIEGRLIHSATDVPSWAREAGLSIALRARVQRDGMMLSSIDKDVKDQRRET